MLAISERVPGTSDAPDKLIWHKPVGRIVEEFQAIACSDEEGITLPWAKRDVPLRLDKPGESWCPHCLKLAKR
ncbi:hypothetical protein [Streptomyces malaysiensis]|uniref:hypothetical protein n=1 Tax=Streptomyces malaysiensis TaxID=92644 RepID=UPI0036B608BB